MDCNKITHEAYDKKDKRKVTEDTASQQMSAAVMQ